MFDSIPSELFESAMDEARAAALAGNVPVGALVCRRTPGSEAGWEIISRGRNRIKERKDPTAHAEMEAVTEACRFLDNERLDNCILISTLEPCLMCSGALVLARVDAVLYFAGLESGLGLQDVLEMDNRRHKPINHRPQMLQIPEFQGASALLLKEFFKNRRKQSKSEPPSDDLAPPATKSPD